MGLSEQQFEFLIVETYLMAFGLDLLLTGIYACIIFFIIYFYYTNPKSRASKSSRILARLIFLMFVIRMVHIGGVWYFTWFSYVKHGDSQDSVFQAVTGLEPLTALSSITSVLTTVIADSIMVWRCWIICNGSWKMAGLPFLLNLLGIAFGFAYVGFSVAEEVSDSRNIDPRFGLMSTLNMSFSLATTILSTLLITIHILMSGNIGNASARKRYSKPMEIIIESSALYSIAFIIYIPFYTVNNDIANVGSIYPSSIAESMTCIAPALIMLRVLMGKARPDHEWTRSRSQSKMTTIRFGDEESDQNDQNNTSHISGVQDGEEESGDIRETTRSQGEGV